MHGVNRLAAAKAKGSKKQGFEIAIQLHGPDPEAQEHIGDDEAGKQ
jgi:hypothetical protein